MSTAATSLLPPWPNELLVAEKKELAIAHLRGLRIPSRIAARHLQRWGEFTGAELEPRDFAAVRFSAGSPGGV